MMDMKRLLLALLMAGASNVFADEGKLIALIGDVSVVRNGQDIKLERGAVVRAGDLVKVAVASSAQLRMSDQSIIALGQGTEFQLNEYKFSAEKPAEGRAFFSLLKGAFRTVTGLIGRHARENYAVKASTTATIGIRGTHYRLRLCKADCAVEGQQAPHDGLYGGVTEGRIGVTNDSGMGEFGADEYFFVADAASRPELLPGPPDLLIDRANFLAKAKGGQAASGSAPAMTSSVVTAPPQMLETGALNALSDLTLQQFRATELVSPETLVHVTPIPDGFADIGGSGVIRGQIVWMTNADIDLHMLAPTGGEVYFGNTTVSLGSATAQLDHDNLGGVIDAPPDQRIENITVTGTQIPVGSYDFSAYSFSGNNNGLPTTVQIRVTGDSNATAQTGSAVLSSGQTSSSYIVDYRGPSSPPIYSVQPR